MGGNPAIVGAGRNVFCSSEHVPMREGQSAAEIAIWFGLRRTSLVKAALSLDVNPFLAKAHHFDRLPLRRPMVCSAFAA